ncbi:MAG: aldehyde:ferredoxin oxidoreductase [Acidobacteria bacterium]|nr:aldehyde:ferredoxin oxidoreductase [Acidobacteriota bacterium]
MTAGYAGKILRVDLTAKSFGTIPTERYEQYGGGHGMGSALFFDLVGDQLPFGAFDPRNPIIMMGHPFAGTFMPGSGRCEVQGLAPMLHPIEWFAHSNFGGRFTAQMKYAGWDGIVVDGASDEPVWINVINDKVTIESAGGIWGMDTWDTQEEVSRRVMPGLKHGEWANVDDGFTTQVPAVVCCGLAGENRSRMGALLHGPGSQAALGGFGGVFGSKNLKAISILGTGSAPIADPQAFMDARLWFRQFLWDVDDPRRKDMMGGFYFWINGSPAGANVTNNPAFDPNAIPLVPARAAACVSCPRACRQRLASGDSNESVCAGTAAVRLEGAGLKQTRQANDWVQKYGLGHWHFMPMQGYIQSLYNRGLLGKGKKIECDLPMDQYGTVGFLEMLMNQIATRRGIGNDLSEGLARAAKKWGTYEKDLKSGELNLAYWGTAMHYDPRSEAEWGFGSLMGERDLMLHAIANYPLHWMPQAFAMEGKEPYLSAEEAVKITADAMIPYEGDVFMLDYSDGPTGIYSEHKVKQVAWVKHYEKFWIGSNGLCGWRWPMCFTCNSAGYRGATPHAEPRFFNAVTGRNITFAEGMELGRRIFTLDRGIWTLQGRDRSMEVFPDYIYEKDSGGEMLPMYDRVANKWSYSMSSGRRLDRAKVEEWKTRFYDFEGFNANNGWPTRKTLEDLDLRKVADVMQAKNRLG